MAFTTRTALSLLIKQVNYKAQPSENLIKSHKSVGVNIAKLGFHISCGNSKKYSLQLKIGFHK